MKLKVTFAATDVSFRPDFAATDVSFRPDFATAFVGISSDIPRYEGEYDVIPQAKTEQILEVKDKLMINNVVVRRIPYAAVSNDADGTTVTIG